MKKEVLKEIFKEATQHWTLTLVNNGTKAAETIKEKANSIRFDSIYSAYGKPSETKVRTYYECVKLAEELSKEINGSIIRRGIQGAGKDNYNYLAIIKSEEKQMKVYLYCTVGNNKIVIEPLL